MAHAPSPRSATSEGRARTLAQRLRVAWPMRIRWPAVVLAASSACGGDDTSGAADSAGTGSTATTAASAPTTAGTAGATGDPSGDTADSSAGDTQTTGEVDPGAAACPWILDGDYTHASQAFFEPSQVIRIDVEMAADDWQFQLDNPDLEEYRTAAVSFCGQRVEGAGMRFKKSTHPNADLVEGYPKNPMILDLNEFAPGQELRGLGKINLEYGGDLMLVAERMNWEMLADFGVEASRVNHAELYVNDAYVGVFTNIERVDRKYAAYHFGQDDGQLYKHAYCGTFEWAGPDPAAYTGDPRCYAPTPEDSPTDYADLIHVIDVLGNTPDGELAAALPAVWNVERWLPMMAALQVIAYGDTPNANANNFYTYHPVPAGPAEVALWDLDGGYWRAGQPCEGDADTIAWDLFRLSACYASLPLFDRVVAVEPWRAQYLEHARAFLEGPFDPAGFSARIDVLVAMLAGPLATDPNRSGDDAQWAADLAELRAQQQLRADNVRQQLVDLGVL